MTTLPARGPAALELARGVGLAVVVALADVIFLAGVVVPDLGGRDPFSQGIALPALLSVFTLPLIAYGAVLVSGRRLLLDRSAGRPLSRVDVVVAALALAGFVAYVSPWGLAAINGFMIALD